MKNLARKIQGLGVFAAILIVAAQPAAAVSYADIMILKRENDRLQSKIERLQDEIESVKRRAMRLTSECDGQKCMLKEAVTYDSYRECKLSITPEKAEFSLCMPMGNETSGDVPDSP
jgi:hypothetical protein